MVKKLRITVLNYRATASLPLSPNLVTHALKKSFAITRTVHPSPRKTARAPANPMPTTPTATTPSRRARRVVPPAPRAFAPSKIRKAAPAGASSGKVSPLAPASGQLLGRVRRLWGQGRGVGDVGVRQGGGDGVGSGEGVREAVGAGAGRGEGPGLGGGKLGVKTVERRCVLPLPFHSHHVAGGYPPGRALTRGAARTTTVEIGGYMENGIPADTMAWMLG